LAYGWEGEKLRLAPLDKQKYLENAVACFNDPETTAYTLGGDWPMTRLAEEGWFDRACKDDTKTRVGFAVETLDGKHIGFTGTIIGPKEYRSRGFGTDVIKVRTQYAFDVINLRLLISEAFADNVTSLKALQKAGYREVARIARRYWRRVAYRDLVLLTIERPH